MAEQLKSLLLRWLKVPPEPEAPAGSAGSVKTFRASPNFYKLKLILWAVRQASGVIGIIIFLTFWSTTVGRKAPGGVNLVVTVAEFAGIVLFLLQLPISWLLVRLDYEMRWYIVTDRSLRIRTGIWSVSETTLTFANIQQITVRQGPLQRLLGIYDLEVTTAGGGSGGGHHGHSAGGDSMHRGFFHGINNAPEVRELIQERLRLFRDAGVGDPDEAHHEAGASTPHASPDLLVAAQELLRETQALRRVAD